MDTVEGKTFKQTRRGKYFCSTTTSNNISTNRISFKIWNPYNEATTSKSNSR